MKWQRTLAPPAEPDVAGLPVDLYTSLLQRTGACAGQSLRSGAKLNSPNLAWPCTLLVQTSHMRITRACRSSGRHTRGTGGRRINICRVPHGVHHPCHARGISAFHSQPRGIAPFYTQDTSGRTVRGPRKLSSNVQHGAKNVPDGGGAQLSDSEERAGSLSPDAIALRTRMLTILVMIQFLKPFRGRTPAPAGRRGSAERSRPRRAQPPAPPPLSPLAAARGRSAPSRAVWTPAAAVPPRHSWKAGGGPPPQQATAPVRPTRARHRRFRR